MNCGGDWAGDGNPAEGTCLWYINATQLPDSHYTIQLAWNVEGSEYFNWSTSANFTIAESRASGSNGGKIGPIVGGVVGGTVGVLFFAVLLFLVYRRGKQAGERNSSKSTETGVSDNLEKLGSDAVAKVNNRNAETKDVGGGLRYPDGERDGTAFGDY